MNGEVDMGLLIHEGQLTFADRGLHLVPTWANGGSRRPAFPLPLGGNVVRKDLGARCSLPRFRATCATASRMDWSIAWVRSTTAMQYARGLDRSKADTFVGMYVNDWTLDYGERGRQAVRALPRARRSTPASMTKPVTVEFVD